jgi:hypothetical protein
MFTAINTLARFIITYYWLFVSSSFSFFFIQAAIYQKHATEIEFSFYALYLAVGGLTRHLLLTKIPAASFEKQVGSVLAGIVWGVRPVAVTCRRSEAGYGASWRDFADIPW